MGAGEVKKIIFEKDRIQLSVDASKHESSQLATVLASEIDESVSWLKIWDTPLDWGPKGTSEMQNIYKELSHPVFGSQPCPCCV